MKRSGSDSSRREVNAARQLRGRLVAQVQLGEGRRRRGCVDEVAACRVVSGDTGPAEDRVEARSRRRPRGRGRCCRRPRPRRRARRRPSRRSERRVGVAVAVERRQKGCGSRRPWRERRRAARAAGRRRRPACTGTRGGLRPATTRGRRTARPSRSPCAASPPPAATTYRSDTIFVSQSSSRADTNAIHSLSGDHVGDMLSKSPSVSWTGSLEPSEATT